MKRALWMMCLSISLFLISGCTAKKNSAVKEGAGGEPQGMQVGGSGGEQIIGQGGSGAIVSEGGQGGEEELGGSGGLAAGNDMASNGGNPIGGEGGSVLGGQGGEPCTDCDEDGFTVAEGDCNDENPAQNPNAEEICDGIDNDCDSISDNLLPEVCYEGPEETLDVGLCRGGTRSCENGGWGECLNQALPLENDICGSGEDEDCNGEQNESCAAIACADIDLDSELTLINTCMAKDTFSKSMMLATLVQQNGNPLPNANVEFTIENDEDVFVENVTFENRYVSVLRTPRLVGEYTLRAVVSCDSDNDGMADSEVTLTRAPILSVVEKAPTSGNTYTGGCASVEGNLRVKVMDKETNQPIPEANVMVGLEEDEFSFTTNALAIAQGVYDGEESNVAVADEDGSITWSDFSGRLTGLNTITVSVDGYKNFTLGHFGGSHAVIYLEPMPSIEDIVAELGAFAPVHFSGSFTEFDNLNNNDFVSAGILFKPLSFNNISRFNFNDLWDGYNCWTPTNNPPANSPIEMAMNLYIPEQQRLVSINEHLFSFFGLGDEAFPTLGFGGVAPTGELFGRVIGARGNLKASDIIELVIPQELGLYQADPFVGDQADIEIPLNTALNPHPGCNISNLPNGSDVICLALGDWEGGNGTGTLFPMGMNIKSQESLDPIDQDADGRRNLPLTTVADVGDFSGIGYMSAALALDLNNARNGVSAIFELEGFSPDNANPIEMNNFYNRLNFVFGFDDVGLRAEWNSAENAESPPVSYCEIEISIEVLQSYNPGVCEDENRRVIAEYPFWTMLIEGEATTASFPLLPISWPQGESQGWIFPEDIRIANGELSYRNKVSLNCQYAATDPVFDFNHADLDASKSFVTHTTTDYVFPQ